MPAKRLFLVVAFASASAVGFKAMSLVAAEAQPDLTWYKGVVHAHANWGVLQLPTTSPDVVVRWYREHNYNFVSVTDLDYYTPPEGLKALANPQLYRTDFIGKGGEILKHDETLKPVYEFTGKELYVRAKITNSDGQVAWTQPIFRK